jgi:hypothetical protein
MSDPRQIAGSTEEPSVSRTFLRPALRNRRSRARSASRPQTPHTQRFRSVLAVLVGLAVGAIVIAVAVGIGGRNHNSSAPWSSWSPPDQGNQGAQDIADRVAPLYRQTATQQLAVVTVVNLISQAAQTAAAQAQANGTTASPSAGLEVAVKPNSNSSQVSLLNGNTVAYNLCGVGGRNCAIGGTASTARLLLLRREALELALYSFKYLQSTQYVVTILPPGRTQPTSTLTKAPPTKDSSSKPLDMAILFDRQELGPLLSQPLSASLPEEFPPTVSEMPNAPEAGLVDQVTARGLFSEQVQQAQDGSRLIVLNPLPPS